MTNSSKYLHYDHETAGDVVARLERRGIHLIGMGPSDSYQITNLAHIFGADPGLRAIEGMRRAAWHNSHPRKKAQDE